MLWTWKGENVNIHVGNLAREVTEAELRQAFGEFGNVAAVRIVTDRHSGVSRGFGFVDMPDRDEAQAAIQGLNMKELAGRTLDLSEARGLRDGRRDSRNPGNTGRGRPTNGRKRGGSGGGRRRF
jgi:RNA recognition motif-containing protein